MNLERQRLTTDIPLWHNSRSIIVGLYLVVPLRWLFEKDFPGQRWLKVTKYIASKCKKSLFSFESETLI